MYLHHFPFHHYFHNSQPIDSLFGLSGNLLAFFGTIILGILAIFGDSIKNLILKPKLRPVEIKRTIQGDGTRDSVMHRLIVKNIRRFYLFGIQAKDVRAILTYRNVPSNFIPIPIRWTHFNNDIPRGIPQGEEVYVDLIHRKKDTTDKYEFCWAPGTGSSDPMLKYFEPKNGDIRLEFFESSQKIGDIYLRYSDDSDKLEVVSHI
ncbi:MAG: hypothetical protein WD898_02185 [Candidatus Paceibacterota bacterium]